MQAAVKNELSRRMTIWHDLERRGGPRRVPPSLVYDLRIVRGQQGVFRDQELTRGLSGGGSGVAVGLRHTGSTYADDISTDGGICHYPATTRGGRDDSEIESLKECRRLGLPVFVVVTPSDDPTTRDVELGWVVDHDDKSRHVLIEFGQNPDSIAESIAHPEADEQFDDAPFLLQQKGRARPPQRRIDRARCAFASRL